MFKRDPPARPKAILTIDQRNKFAHFFILLMTIDKQLQKKSKSKEIKKSKIKLNDETSFTTRRTLFFLLAYLSLSSQRAPQPCTCERML